MTICRRMKNISCIRAKIGFFKIWKVASLLKNECMRVFFIFKNGGPRKILQWQPGVLFQI